MKEHYRIEHIVQVREGNICIGSSYLPSLIVIGADGELRMRDDSTSNKDLVRYMREIDADAVRLLQQEKAILEATELICGILKESKLSRAELADRLGKSRGWISQLLDGSANMTLRTLADVFTALGYELRLGACQIEQHIDFGGRT